MKSRLVFLFLLWLALVASFGQETPVYHDASLDAINNNLGYLDADLNGHMDELPYRVATTNLQVHTNQFKSVMEAGTLGKLSDRRRLGTIGSSDSVVVNFGSAKGTNGGALTNLVSSIFGGTVGGVLTNGSGYSTNDALDGTNSPTVLHEIPIPNVLGQNWKFDVSFGTGGYLSRDFAKYVRGLLILIEYVMLFLLLLEALKEDLTGTMNQRQIQGSTESVLGTNASVVVGLGYAVAITAAVAVAITGLFAAGTWSLFASAGSVGGLIASVFNFGQGVPGWDVITAYIPFWNTIIVSAAYFFLRYVVMLPLFLMVRAIIFWCVA